MCWGSSVMYGVQRAHGGRSRSPVWTRDVPWRGFRHVVWDRFGIFRGNGGCLAKRQWA